MVKLPNRDSYGIKRLESQNAKNAIIQKLANDFNLTPIIAFDLIKNSPLSSLKSLSGFDGRRYRR